MADDMNVKLSPNMENYLETIHLLQMENGYVRVKDIAGMMEITMPSVSSAMKTLEKQGLVQHPRYDHIMLTPRGRTIAEELCRRHRLIKDFLSRVLGLDHEIAERDACVIEHVISPETVEGLSRFLESSGMAS